jgi:hypothetical protein
MRTLIAFVLVSFLPVATPTLSAAYLSNITTSPTSPAPLYFGDSTTGDRVTWEFYYSVDVTARIHGLPMCEGVACPGYRVSGSPLYPAGTSGFDTGYFFFEDPYQGATHVDHIRFRIYDANHTTVLWEYWKPVDFTYVTHPLLLGDINQDGAVNGLDVGPFVDTVIGGGAADAVVPEPNGVLLTTVALVGLFVWRRGR